MNRQQAARTRRWVRQGLLFASALAAASSATSAQFTPQGAVLQLTGRLEPGDGARLAAALAPGVQLLRVQSPGGDVQAALDAAELLRARALPVAVDGLCAAECAQFLLPAAAGLAIAPGSVIALASGPTGTYLAALRESRLDAPELQAFRLSMDALQTQVTRHSQTYRQDTAALEFMLRLTSPADIRATLEPGEGGRPTLSMRGARSPLCAAWLLDADTLAALGVQTGPWTPPTLWQAALRLRQPPTALYRGPVLSPQQLQAASQCSALSGAR